MQLFVNISSNPNNGLERKILVDKFIWAIHESNITVPCRIYHIKSNGDLDETIPFRIKELPVSNEFMVDPSTGGVIINYDPEIHVNAVPQYDYMLALTVYMVGAGSQDKISDVLIGLITQNILEADGRGIFN